MAKSLTLAQYVKKRNGLPLGASGSLTAMLKRSLGAGSFAMFWRFWNPVWGFYLARYIQRPLSQYLPSSVVIVVTFLVSGALHDLAVSLIKAQGMFFFTPWFSLMGCIVVITSALKMNYQALSWPLRALFNSTFLLISFIFVSYLTSLAIV